MILVDKEIKIRGPEIIKENYNQSYIQPLSYSIHIDETKYRGLGHYNDVLNHQTKEIKDL